MRAQLTKRAPVAALGAAALLMAAACSSSSGTTKSGAADTPFVKKVKAAVTQMETAQTTWTGPTSGPIAQRGKHLVYLSGQQSNSLDAAYGKYLQEAARQIGWAVTIIDGQGTRHLRPAGHLARRPLRQRVPRRLRGHA